MTVFTVVERLWRGEDVATGWTGTTLQGSLQWNSMDLLRTRLISKCECSKAIISRRRAYAPNRLVLMNPDL